MSAERLAALEAVAEAARNAAAGRTGWGFVRDALATLDALPVEPEPVAATVDVRAAVFSNGANGWTVYGSSDMQDASVLAVAHDDLGVDGMDESHVAWITAAVALPIPTIPTIRATVATDDDT
jgi:hypothetical protein